MAKFKVGQKIKVVGSITDSARNNQGYIGIITRVGDEIWGNDTRMIKETGKNFYEIDDKVEVWDNDIILVQKDWEDLEVGDIIVDSGGDEAMILAHVGLLFGRSKKDKFNEHNDFYTKEELIESGWSIKQDVCDEEEVEELTMEQVCKELGREVKIKK